MINKCKGMPIRGNLSMLFNYSIISKQFLSFLFPVPPNFGPMKDLDGSTSFFQLFKSATRIKISAGQRLC